VANDNDNPHQQLPTKKTGWWFAVTSLAGLIAVKWLAQYGL